MIVRVAGATFTTDMMAMVVKAQVVVKMVMAITGMLVVGGDYYGSGPGVGADDVEDGGASLLVAQAIAEVIVIMIAVVVIAGQAVVAVTS